MIIFFLQTIGLLWVLAVLGSSTSSLTLIYFGNILIRVIKLKPSALLYYYYCFCCKRKLLILTFISQQKNYKIMSQSKIFLNIFFISMFFP